MGFKVKVSWVQCGSDEFPYGSGTAMSRKRSETLLSKCGQLLIDTGTGWELDEKRNDTLFDFTEIPTRNDYTYYPGLFFINSISGCKLFMCYIGDYVPGGYGVKNFDGNSIVLSSGYDYTGGLCFSIIPAGSDSEFGDPLTSTFLPHDATRICGTCYGRSGAPAAYNPTNGVYYGYWVGATPYAIICYASHGDAPFSQMYGPIFITGRIFSDLIHEEDTSLASKYGTLFFRKETGSSGESWTGFMRIDRTLFSTLVFIPGSFEFYGPVGACVRSVNGYYVSSVSGTNVAWFPYNSELMANKLYKKEGSVCYSPLFVSVCSDNLQSFGVKPNDGRKGFIDPDLVVAAVCSRDQHFCNNKYVCVEDGENLLFGLDDYPDSVQ